MGLRRKVEVHACNPKSTKEGEELIEEELPETDAEFNFRPPPWATTMVQTSGSNITATFKINDYTYTTEQVPGEEGIRIVSRTRD